jgi:hypothetical protein
MDGSTYDVRLWKVEKYSGARTTTYYVWWVVAGKQFKKPFVTRALADSFRATLFAAAREGTTFEVETGLPVPLVGPSRSSRVVRVRVRVRGHEMAGRVAQPSAVHRRRVGRDHRRTAACRPAGDAKETRKLLRRDSASTAGPTPTSCVNCTE